MRALRAAAVVGALFVAGAAQDASGEPPPEKDWEVELLAHGWLPRLDAEFELPNGTTADVDIGMDDVLESLDFAAKGRVSARWRRWVVAADALWADLGQDERFERGPIRIDGDFDQELALVQVLGGYRVFSREGGSLPRRRAERPAALRRRPARRRQLRVPVGGRVALARAGRDVPGRVAPPRRLERLGGARRRPALPERSYRTAAHRDARGGERLRRRRRARRVVAAHHAPLLPLHRSLAGVDRAPAAHR